MLDAVTTTSAVMPETTSVTSRLPGAFDADHRGAGQGTTRALRLDHIFAGRDTGERVAAVGSAGGLTDLAARAIEQTELRSGDNAALRVADAARQAVGLCQLRGRDGRCQRDEQQA